MHCCCKVLLAASGYCDIQKFFTPPLPPPPPPTTTIIIMIIIIIIIIFTSNLETKCREYYYYYHYHFKVRNQISWVTISRTGRTKHWSCSIPPVAHRSLCDVRHAACVAHFVQERNTKGAAVGVGPVMILDNAFERQVPPFVSNEAGM